MRHWKSGILKNKTQIYNDEFFLSRLVGHPLTERDNKTQFGTRICDFNKLSSAGGGGFEEAGGGKIYTLYPNINPFVNSSLEGWHFESQKHK